MLDYVNSKNPMVITYSMWGCFGGTFEITKIRRGTQGFEYDIMDVKTGQAIRSGKCRSGFERAYSNFESKGTNLNGDGYCTSIESYSINARQNELHFSNKSCDPKFDEYEKLKKYLK